jgi:hypothetical protein
MTPTAPFSVTARRISFDRFHDLRRNHRGVFDSIAGALAEIIRPVVVGLCQLDGEV